MAHFVRFMIVLGLLTFGFCCSKSKGQYTYIGTDPADGVPMYMDNGGGGGGGMMVASGGSSGGMGGAGYGGAGYGGGMVMGGGGSSGGQGGMQMVMMSGGSSGGAGGAGYGAYASMPQQPVYSAPPVQYIQQQYSQPMYSPVAYGAYGGYGGYGGGYRGGFGAGVGFNVGGFSAGVGYGGGYAPPRRGFFPRRRVVCGPNGCVTY